MIAKKILCTGKVQGVFYRASTKEQAQKIGLKGWVKNQSDGTVLIHVEGDTRQIDKLVEWCRSGPPNAKVTSVEVSDSEVQGLTSFEITH